MKGDDDIVCWFSGEPLTAQKILEGLNCQLPAIQFLWPRWGNYAETEKVPCLGEMEKTKMQYDLYPAPVHVSGYCMYPPETYTDHQKWTWLITLLQCCGEISKNIDVATKPAPDGSENAD